MVLRAHTGKKALVFVLCALSLRDTHGRISLRASRPGDRYSDGAGGGGDDDWGHGGRVSPNDTLKALEKKAMPLTFCAKAGDNDCDSTAPTTGAALEKRFGGQSAASWQRWIDGLPQVIAARQKAVTGDCDTCKMDCKLSAFGKFSDVLNHVTGAFKWPNGT